MSRERDALEGMARQFAYHNDSGQIHTGGLSALEEAFEVLGWPDPMDDTASTCDEPGCGREATCGWPSTPRYRWTCYEHSDLVKR